MARHHRPNGGTYACPFLFPSLLRGKIAPVPHFLHASRKQEDACPFGFLFWLSIQPAEDVQVVVHDGTPAHRDGKLVGQKLEPFFDPRLAVLKTLAAQERPANTPRNAVVVPRDIDMPPAVAGPSSSERPPTGILNARILLLRRPSVKDYACPFPSLLPFPSFLLFCSSPAHTRLLSAGLPVAPHRSLNLTDKYGQCGDGLKKHDACPRPSSSRHTAESHLNP
jgi:hypothetical protein